MTPLDTLQLIALPNLVLSRLAWKSNMKLDAVLLDIMALIGIIVFISKLIHAHPIL
jgi:hypothetical protein